MSKRSLFWGQASGKLGEAVYYRAGGEQRTRTWVPKIKNPKTLAQVENRLSLLNLVTTYKEWSDIIKTAFPLKKTNQSDYNAFVSRNKDATSSVISKEEAQARLSVPDGMILTNGDIPLFISTRISSDIITNANGQYGVTATGLTFSKTPIEFETWEKLKAGGPELTGGDVYRALVGDDNPMNLPAQFKLFVCVGLFEDVESPTGAPDLGGCNKNYAYITCAAEGTDTIHVVGNANNVNIKFAPAKQVTAGNSEVAKYLVLSNTGAASTAMYSGVYTAIISYTDGSKQKVTTSQFGAADGVNAGLFLQYKPGGEIYNYALQQMGYNPNSVIATK